MANQSTAGFVHTVFFWLVDGLTDEQRQALERDLRTLGDIETVLDFKMGKPAQTPREVVDNSYDYAITVVFADKAGHDFYQEVDAHHAFIAAQKHTWKRVQVFDYIPM